MRGTNPEAESEKEKTGDEIQEMEKQLKESQKDNNQK